MVRAAGGLGLLDEEEDEETFVSSYEKAHPLEVPRALTEANQWQLLKAIGVLEDDKVGGDLDNVDGCGRCGFMEQELPWGC